MVVAIPVYMVGRTVYYHEKVSNMYRPFTYVTGYAVAEVPYLVVPFYFMLGLNANAVDFAWFLAPVLTMSSMGCHWGHFLAVALPNPEV
jgi:hypothetical protein